MGRGNRDSNTKIGFSSILMIVVKNKNIRILHSRFCKGKIENQYQSIFRRYAPL